MNISGINIQIENGPSGGRKNRAYFGCLLLITASFLLLLILPQARNGLKLLADRLFSASEAVNPYIYERFEVPEGQSAGLALLLLGLIGLCLLLMALLRRDPLYILACAVFLSIGQIYFGLSFPAWLNGLLYALFGCLLIPGLRWKKILIFLVTLACVSGIICIYNAGVDPSIEGMSETVRDRLSGVVMISAGMNGDASSELTGTRHVNSRSLRSGNDAAETDREFRLVTVEEVQISRPDPLAVLSEVFPILAGIVLLALLIFLAVRFLKRRKQIRALRKAFLSENICEAVFSMFRYVLFYLRRGGFEEKNRLLRNRKDGMRDVLPVSYTDLYEKGVSIFEEALYSGHELGPEHRALVKDLLDETRRLVFERIDRKSRFRLLIEEHFGEI